MTRTRRIRAGSGATAPRWRTVAAPLGLALAAATVAGAALPRATYTAAAVVGVDGGPASLRPALIQAAANAARSRQVAARAAGTLPAGMAMRPETLVAAVRVDAGRAPGTLVLRADDADAERAAALASAVAGALVAELGDRTPAARRDGDTAAALRLSRLQEAAADAHRKLAALGDGTADPAAPRAAARAEALRTRLDAIRSILAAGNPPLGAGRDLPPAIDALQTSYLDLTRQLAKARETLGERHTTVVGLQDAVRRAAAELDTAWKRLAKAAEQELAEAKSRVAVPTASTDADRATALAAARAAARVADDALARAVAPLDADDPPRWHLVARDSTPALAEGGLGLAVRLALAAATGLLALLLGRVWLGRRRDTAAEPVAAETMPATAIEPTFFDEAAALAPPADEPPFVHDAMSDPTSAHEDADAAPSTVPAAASLSWEEETELEAMIEATVATPATGTDLDLVAASAQVLATIDALQLRADVPVVLVTTDEAGVDTTPTLLALGAAAAADGRRVLLVETGDARPGLAAAADPDAEPALADVLGETRIVLRAEAGAGHVFLAAALSDGARLAADLARAGTALVADALADEFDLVVLDAHFTDAVAVLDRVDAVLRVARFAAPRDAGRFMAALGAPDGTLLGTLATAVSLFVPHVARPAALVAATAPGAAAPRALHAPHPSRRQATIEARRRVGSR